MSHQFRSSPPSPQRRDDGAVRDAEAVQVDGARLYRAWVMLMLPLLCIHHDRDVWGEDANEFRLAEGIARAAFFPFGGGPRTCNGQSFALLEAKMGLAMILRSFEIELSPSYSHAPFPSRCSSSGSGSSHDLTLCIDFVCATNKDWVACL
ncbi:hypothetical protein HU200_019138 [Digitaria exilis]|uniref:Cytochrome P450 n=1 Tax=Digitaria exilis TaxID=1010633 RepID=A0A835KFB3_9POAL|nr:hypothetical protein HU200_019138 [Digitaria exilis]